MYRSLFLIFTIYGISCTMTIPKNYHSVKTSAVLPSEGNCRNTFEFVNKKWFVHNENRCCLYNEKVTNLIERDAQCFVGLTREQVKMVLGEPNQISRYLWFYHVNLDCNSHLPLNHKYTINVWFGEERNDGHNTIPLSPYVQKFSLVKEDKY